MIVLKLKTNFHKSNTPVRRKFAISLHYHRRIITLKGWTVKECGSSINISYKIAIIN
jgi:hypothetical protein